MIEGWKEIRDYEDYYEVSNFGRVRSLDRVSKSFCKRYGKVVPIIQKYSGRVLKPVHIHKSGYNRVELFKNGVGKFHMIHRLVLDTFCPCLDKRLQVNHKDGNKDNNTIFNLEWCTSAENNKHAFFKGLNKPRKGEECPMSKLKNRDVRRIKTAIMCGIKQSELVSIFNVCPSTISQIKMGNTWKHILMQTQVAELPKEGQEK